MTTESALATQCQSERKNISIFGAAFGNREIEVQDQRVITQKGLEIRDIAVRLFVTE